MIYHSRFPLCSLSNSDQSVHSTYVSHTVSPDDVVLIQPNAEPYQSFRAAVPRFCQVKEMRLALDFIRYFKLPQYMRWDKFGQTKLRSDTEFPAIPLIQEALADDEEELPMQTGADNPLVLDDQPLEEETSLTPDPSDMQTEDTSDLNHESLDSFTAVEEIETMKAASTDERAEFHSRLSDYFTRLIHRESGDANSFAMENELKNLLEEEGVTVQSSDGKSFKVDLFHFFQWMEPHSPSRESSEHQWAAYLSDASLPDDSQLVVELRNIYSK
jgi:hypothetical protein